MVWYEILGGIFMVIGSIFLFLGALGILRMPDVYNRLQAGTKATTLGAFASIVGVGIYNPVWFWKTLVIAVFILLTDPVSSHALARAAHFAGIKLTDKTVYDALKEDENKDNKGEDNE